MLKPRDIIIPVGYTYRLDVPCFLELEGADEFGNPVAEYKVSPYGCQDPDRDAYWVDSLQEARDSVAEHKRARPLP